VLLRGSFSCGIDDPRIHIKNRKAFPGIAVIPSAQSFRIRQKTSDSQSEAQHIVLVIVEGLIDEMFGNVITLLSNQSRFRSFERSH
jgi:hypothetical protein